MPHTRAQQHGHRGRQSSAAALLLVCVQFDENEWKFSVATKTRTEELIEWVVEQKMYSEKWRMNAT